MPSDPDLFRARVCFAAHEQYRVLIDLEECDAEPTGRLRYSELLPAVGDWVMVRRIDAGLALIESVLPRRTQFSRRAAGDAVAEQVMAANVDFAIIVCGLDGNFNLRRLERYLVLARESGAEPVVVLNKADLCGDVAARIAEAESVTGGVPVLALSALAGASAVAELSRGRTVVFLGSSGVGKSTIVNALLGEARQATAEVRAADSKGRHTTTNRMLLPLPDGGAIIDTPGMRELQLWAGGESLDEVFVEIAAIAEGCRFGDCTHTSEPGCAVRAALDNGELEPARWQSYAKLQRELEHHRIETDVQARLAHKRAWKAIHKSLRDHPKYKR
jgi:ribosome biogenesis GTPase / thiamine phosphate phosphatase